MEVKINLYQIKIPFKVNFKHNSFDRSETYSVLVECIINNTYKGYGEGCPRSYVTNESIESVRKFITNHHTSLTTSINSLEDLLNWSNEHNNEILENLSAWAAIETAFLDAIGKLNQCSIEQLLSITPILDSSNYQYSAILGDGDIVSFTKQLEQYIKLGFRSFKIKICGDLSKELYKFDALKQYKHLIDSVRLDANNLWTEPISVIDYINSLPISILGIEEPLKTKNKSELLNLSKKLPIPIILDENFINENDFNQLNSNNNFIFNLRISKNGGIIRSLKLAQLIQSNNFRYIIGAQVGETSILTRCALVVSNHFNINLIAQEGAFGSYLLTKDIIENELKFGPKGILAFTAQQPYGLQLEMPSFEHLQILE